MIPARKSCNPASAEIVAEAYRAYAPVLLRVLYTKLPSIQDAHDVCQEVFESLLQVKDLAEVQDVRSYIYSIAHFKISKLYRRRRSSSLPIDDTLEAFEEMKRVASEEGEKSLELEILAAEAQAVLRAMPANRRRVALCCIFLGQSSAEVAKDMGLSERTVEGYRCAAMRELNDRLMGIKVRSQP